MYFLVPGFFLPGFSRPGFRHQLLNAFSRPARKNTTNQNLLRQNFIAYIFRSQERKPQAPKTKGPPLTSLGARAPARQSARAQSKSSIVYIFRSKRARARAREQKRKSASKRENGGNPVPFKENYPSPRTYHSLIGCSPWPSCCHGEGRVHGVEKYPWHMRRLFVYHLEHSCQRHLVTANVGAASHSSPFSINKSNRPPILMRVEIEVKSPVCR